MARMLWIVDNSASLFALIEGASNNCNLERIVAAFHFICYMFDITVFFEYVDSKSNYSDGISRLLDQDPWCRKHEVRPELMNPQPWWWEQELHSLWSLIEESSVGVTV